jgi:hypothetical protein
MQHLVDEGQARWLMDWDNKDDRKKLSTLFRQMEQAVIFELITFPALVHIYGDAIRNVTDQQELKYYTSKKEVKTAQYELTYEILGNAWRWSRPLSFSFVCETWLFRSGIGVEIFIFMSSPEKLFCPSSLPTEEPA